MAASKKLDYIQALRALAVMGVLCFHYPGQLYISGRGYIGVDLFFVISGYIMVYTTTTSDGSLAYLKKFYLKRLARIWPVYAIVTLITFLVCDRGNALTIAAFLKWYAESVLFVPLWVRMAIDKPGWTLNFEVYFYFIFGISMLGGKGRWLVFAAIILLTLVGIPYWCTQHGLRYNAAADGLAGYGALITNPIIWDFVLGVCVGLAALKHAQIGHGRLTFIAALLCAAVIAFLYFALALDHGPVPWGIAFAALMLLLDLHNNVRPIKVPRPVLYIGDISYSLYLTNMLVQWVFYQYVPITALHVRYQMALFIPYLGALLALSALSYRFLEQGVAKALRRDFLKRPRASGAKPVQAD